MCETHINYEIIFGMILFCNESIIFPKEYNAKMHLFFVCNIIFVSKCPQKYMLCLYVSYITGSY